MTLSDLREFILRNRRRVLVGAVILVLILIGVGVIYRRYIASLAIPEEAKISPLSLSEETARIRGRVDLSRLSSTEFPEEIVIYQAKLIDVSFAESEMIDLAARLGFTGEPQRLALQSGREDLLFFKEGETLSISSQPRALNYTVDSIGGGEGEVYDQSAAIEKAEEFLEDKGLSSAELIPFKTYHWDWGVNVYIEAANPTDADFVEVSLVCLVGGQSLIGETTAGASASVIFDRQGKVVSLGFSFLDNSFVRLNSVKLLSYEEALSKLPDEGLVVSTYEPGSVTDWALAPRNLYLFTPESVQLVYFQPTESDLLYPIYLFEGVGRATAGTEVNATVYLLAVSPEYIKVE